VEPENTREVREPVSEAFQYPDQMAVIFHDVQLSTPDQTRFETERLVEFKTSSFPFISN
jgi:hypothetical protein